MRLPAVALSFVIFAQAQTQPPRFRTGVDVVELDVTVLDRDRRPVHGLTAADFTVLEDGQPQEIVAFDQVDVPAPDPAAPAWMRDVAPDVRSNDLLSGRLLVLVLDDATMPPNPATVKTAKEIARAAIEQLGPQDNAAVLFTRDNSNSVDFTNDRTRLTRAVGKLSPGFIRPGSPFPTPPLGQGPPSPFRQPRATREDALWYRYSIDTVRRAAEYLREAPQRRKTLLYISVGVPVEFTPGGSDAESGLQGDLAAATQRAFVQAVQSNVTIYGMDPAGLQTDDARLSTDFLRTISENTGGFAVVNTNAPEAQMTSVMRESGSYYLLGFQSTNQRADGRFRRITVRVNRPDVTVRARRGYYGPRRSPESLRPAAANVASAAKAIGGLLPKGDLPMQAAVAPFAVPGKRESALAIVTRVLQSPVSERQQQKIDVVTALFDGEGKPKGGTSQTVTLTLRPGETHWPYELLLRMDVKPGRYLMRIGAHNVSTGLSGSVYHDLDVPDFSKAALALSGIVLASTPAVPGAPQEAFAALLPIVPTTQREFGREHAVTLFVRVYQGGRGSPSPTDVNVRILDAGDKTVFRRTDALGPESFADRAADYRLELPISNLAPGPHVLAIEATAGRSSARRDVRFLVRP